MSKKTFSLIGILALLIVAVSLVWIFSKNTEEEVSLSNSDEKQEIKAPSEVSNKDSSEDSSDSFQENSDEVLEKEEEENEEVKEEENEPNDSQQLPKQFKLDVPFEPQSPFAEWDHTHNEACEEAAIIMVHFFLTGEELTSSVANEEILEMVQYQKDNWGGHYDLEAKEIGELAEEFYGYEKVRVEYGISIKDIKEEIYNENPVILPTAGRNLNNPYYRDPGPPYHALVAIGWNEEDKEMIVNDPGTKRGESFPFSYENLLDSIHEWNGGNIDQGRRAMILIEKANSE